jgi:hypothetical protein
VHGTSVEEETRQPMLVLRVAVRAGRDVCLYELELACYRSFVCRVAARLEIV